MKKLVAVLIAAAALAVVGSFTGRMVGLRELSARDQAGPAPRGGTGTPASVANRSGRPCLDFTEREARKRFNSPGNLIQVLYIKTAGSEVWICQDTLGNLFYQGHRMSVAEVSSGRREPFGDTNSLLLQTVVRQAGGTWVATNETGIATTVYRASATHLVIDYSDGRQGSEDVIQHEP